MKAIITIIVQQVAGGGWTASIVDDDLGTIRFMSSGVEPSPQEAVSNMFSGIEARARNKFYLEQFGEKSS